MMSHPNTGRGEGERTKQKGGKVTTLRGRERRKEGGGFFEGEGEKRVLHLSIRTQRQIGISARIVTVG